MAGRLLLIGELTAELRELKAAFETIGLIVETAQDGIAGIEKGTEFQPDLVVTEILINRLSGFELASRIGTGEAGFTAPVIFYTEFYRDEKARRQVLAKYQAVQYLVRPFQKEDLKKSVAGYFSEFLAERAVASVPGGVPEPAGAATEAVVNESGRFEGMTAKKRIVPGHAQPVLPLTGGASSKAPVRPGFTLGAQTPAGHVAKTLEAGRMAAEQLEGQQGQRGNVPAPVSDVLSACAQDSTSLILPVGLDEPLGIRRLFQPTVVKIAALLMLAALTVYLVRDQFRPASKQERME